MTEQQQFENPWIEGQFTLGNLSPQETSQFITQLTRKYLSTGTGTPMESDSLHSTMIYIGHGPVTQAQLDWARQSGLDKMQFECQIQSIGQGTHAKHMILLFIHSDQYCETFDSTYHSLTQVMGIEPQHSLVEGHYKGFSAHITLAKCESEAEAARAFTQENAKAFIQVLKEKSETITVSDFHFYADDPQGKTVLLV